MRSNATHLPNVDVSGDVLVGFRGPSGRSRHRTRLFPPERHGGGGCIGLRCLETLLERVCGGNKCVPPKKILEH